MYPSTLSSPTGLSSVPEPATGDDQTPHGFRSPAGKWTLLGREPIGSGRWTERGDETRRLIIVQDAIGIVAHYGRVWHSWVHSSECEMRKVDISACLDNPRSDPA